MFFHSSGWVGILLERGHRVTLIASPIYQKAAESGGDRFPSAPESGRAAADASEFGSLGSGRRAKKWRSNTPAVPSPPARRPSTGSSGRHGKPDLMLAPMISFGARIAREKHGIPLITVHLYPAAMMSADDAPLVLPGARLLRHLPHPVRRFVLSLPSPYDRFALPEVVKACSDHGVEPPRRLWKQWHHSPDGVLALYPDWFSSVKRDMPRNTFQWDFPLGGSRAAELHRAGLGAISIRRRKAGALHRRHRASFTPPDSSKPRPRWSPNWVAAPFS